MKKFPLTIRFALIWAALMVSGHVHAQTWFSKYGPVAGIQCNTGSTYLDRACTNLDLQAALSPGFVLNGATGGNMGAGSGNFSALYINGAPVGTSTGAVSSVGLGSPDTTLFTVTGSPVTSAGTLAFVYATGQPTHRVLGTGTTGTWAPLALTAADLPGTITSNTSGNAATSTALAATPTQCGGGNYSIGIATSGNAICNTLPTVPVAGNPSGLIGLTASNGVATTWERSDATHALDQSIAPTWTGAHTFSGNPVTLTNNAHNLLLLNNSGAGFGTIQNDAASTWSLGYTTTAGTLGTSILKWNSSGNVTLATPTGGNTLTVNAFSAQAGISIASASGQYAGINFAQAGQTAAYIYNPASTSNLVVQTGGIDRITVGSAGAVSINAPGSGAALTINGLAGSYTSVVQGPTTTGQSFGLSVNAGTNGSDVALRIANAANTTMATFSGSGGFSIAAPTGGINTLAITGGGTTDTMLIQGATGTGNSFGLRINAGTNSSDRALVLLNAASSANLLTVNGDGGMTVGSPTGGDKGLGTVNMTGCFVNNVPCLVGGTNATKFTAGVFTIGTSTCTTATNTANIASCAWDATGQVTVSFASAYSTATCVTNAVDASPVLVSNGPGSSITSNVNVEMRNASTSALANGSFSLICVGT